MAMKDLGKSAEADIYPSVPDGKGDKQEKYYPSITLPLDLIDKNELELGQEVTLTLKGKVTRTEQSKYCREFSVELRQGECIQSDSDDSSENESSHMS